MFNQKQNQLFLQELAKVDFDLTGAKDKKSKVIIQRLNLVSKLMIKMLKVGTGVVVNNTVLEDDKKFDLILKELSLIKDKIEILETQNGLYTCDKSSTESTTKFIPSISTKGMIVTTQSQSGSAITKVIKKKKGRPKKSNII